MSFKALLEGADSADHDGGKACDRSANDEGGGGVLPRPMRELGFGTHLDRVTLRTAKTLRLCTSPEIGHTPRGPRT